MKKSKIRRHWRDSHLWPFMPMADLIPEGQVDGARVTHFTIDEEKAEHYNLMSVMSFSGGYGRLQVAPGRYCRLHVGNGYDPMMSDTQHEQDTCREFVRKAEGDVLIGGLGIGMVVQALLRRHDRRRGRRQHRNYFTGKYDRPWPSKIRSITVVEINPAVIELVAPHLTDPRLTVVEGDIFTWKPEPGQKFDAIWFDIWPESSEDNLEDIAKLHQRGKYWKRSKESFMDSWERWRLRSERAASQRRGSHWW